MKKFINAIAITATLVLAQSCSLSANTHQHGDHAMNDHHHGDHSISEKKVLTQVKLKVPDNITTNKNIPLVIDVQDLEGKAIASFDTFQEQLMHLIIVSDDLRFFNHIHPAYKNNGRFEIATSFPQAGSYTLFSDYKPAGQIEQVSVSKTKVPGQSVSAPEINLNRSKTFNDTKVNLALSEPTVKAGKEVTLTFNLQDAANNQPLTDLQPYLGETGHLVILRQSPSLTAADYIHAHALKNTPPGQVNFMTSFPQPGKYKLWGQFNRNGKIITADFWVDVSS